MTPTPLAWMSTNDGNILWDTNPLGTSPSWTDPGGFGLRMIGSGLYLFALQGTNE
jgi:hypothetical protein